MGDRKEYLKNYQREWMRRRRAEFFEGKSCVKCSSNARLELHHINPEEKEHHCIWSWSKQRREAELIKCQILCHECHLIKTKEFLSTKIGTLNHRYIECPKGMAHCGSGQHFAPINAFGIDINQRNGLYPSCKECRNKKRRKNGE